MSEKDLEDGCCLMIRTKDRRKFYTSEQNLGQLIEFSKIMKAEISVVKVKDAKVLDLPDLAPAICDANFTQSQPVACEILEVKLPPSKRVREDMIKLAADITNYVKDMFLTGKPVSLHDLKNKYAECGLTIGCLCNHLTRIRKNLEASGHKITKTGRGSYCLLPPPISLS